MSEQSLVTARNSTVTTGNTAYQLIGAMQQVIDREIAVIKYPEVVTYDIWNNSVPDRAVRALRLRVSGYTRNPPFTEDFVMALGGIMVESQRILNQAVANHEVSGHNFYRIMHRKGNTFTSEDHEGNTQITKTSGVWQITIYYLSGTKDRTNHTNPNDLFYIWQKSDGQYLVRQKSNMESGLTLAYPKGYKNLISAFNRMAKIAG